jgi:ketosteroid isomerase-like protein
MSEENVEFVRKLLNVWNEFMRSESTGEALAATLDQNSCEMRWHDQQTYPDTPQLLQGVPEITAFCEQYRDGWDDFAAEPLELTEAPAGRVLGLIRQSGKGRQSGVPIEIHFFQIWTIRDGRARKIEYFRHRADALEAAGLSE